LESGQELFGAGLAYGTLGYTHHAVEDLAIIRAMEGLAIYSPADSFELTASMRRILSRKEPAYLRLGKGGETPLHDSVPANSEQGIDLTGPGDAEWVVVSTGSIGANVTRAIASMAPELGGRTRHYSIPIFSAVTSLAQEFKDARGIVCVEEHRPSGGLGSLVLETLSGLGLQIPVRRLGIKPGKTKMVGSQDYLLSQHGLDVMSLQAEFEAFFSQVAAEKNARRLIENGEKEIPLHQP
jgi:transketolase